MARLAWPLRNNNIEDSSIINICCQIRSYLLAHRWKYVLHSDTLPCTQILLVTWISVLRPTHLGVLPDYVGREGIFIGTIV